MLQRTQMLHQTRRNTIGRRSTRERMTCRTFPLWLERQSSSLLMFVRFSFQFRSVICLFVQCMKVKQINFTLILHLHFLLCIIFFRPPLWSSGQSFWLQIQRSQVRFPALPDFLSSSESGTGTTQPREVNWGATWVKSSGSGLENTD